MNLRRVLIAGATLAPLAAVVHCSLVNSFDDVVPQSNDGSTPVAEAGSEASIDTGDSAISDASVEAEAAVKVVGGAIVAIASEFDGSASAQTQLIVIDPTTGNRFPNTKSEFLSLDGGAPFPGHFEAVVYDRDLDFWYIIVTEPRALDDDPIKLTVMVRRLDEKTGQWRTWGGANTPISKVLTGLPAPYFGDGKYVASNGRLVYLADSASAPQAIADIVDIAIDGDGGAPSRRDGGGPQLNGIPIRAIASPASNVINYLYAPGSCSDAGDAGACELTIDTVSVPVGGPIVNSSINRRRQMPRFPIDDTTSSTPTGVAYEHGTAKDLYLAVSAPASSPTPGTTVYGYEPKSFGTGLFPSGLGSKLTITGADAFRRFAPLAVAECSPVIFLVEQIGELNIVAIPLMEGVLATRARHDVTNANVAFEPFTGSAIVYGVSSGGKDREFNAYLYSNTGMDRFARRDDRTRLYPWQPPANLAFRSLDVRRPRNFTCP